VIPDGLTALVKSELQRDLYTVPVFAAPLCVAVAPRRLAEAALLGPEEFGADLYVQNSL
jgi:hypothetical protein